MNRKASFLFIGDVNTHHGEWLGSSKTNLYGRTARVCIIGYKQMIMEPTHTDGEVLDFVLTCVRDVVRVRVG